MKSLPQKSTLPRLLTLGIFTFALSVFSAKAAPPGNDRIGDAAFLSGTFDTANGTTVDATREAGERAETGENTVWYRWTAPAAGRARFSASPTGDRFNFKRVTVWAHGGTGNGETLVLIGGADDYSSTVEIVDIPVASGKIYYFCIGHYSLSHGTAPGAFSCAVVLDTNSDISSLQIGSANPDNDQFSKATAMTGNDTSSISYMLESPLREAGEPALNGNFTSWWKWTATEDGELLVSLAGSDKGKYYAIYEDKMLTAYEASSFSEMVNEAPLARSAVQTGLPGTLRFNVIAGQTYHICAGIGRTSNDSVVGGTNVVNLGWRIATLRFYEVEDPPPPPPPAPLIDLLSPGRKVGRSFRMSARVTNPDSASYVLFRVGSSRQAVSVGGETIIKSKRFRSRRKPRRKGWSRVRTVASVFEPGGITASDFDSRRSRSKFKKHR